MDIAYGTFGPRHHGVEYQEYRLIENWPVQITVRLHGGPLSNSFAYAVALDSVKLTVTDLRLEVLGEEWVTEATACKDMAAKENFLKTVAEELANDMRVVLQEFFVSQRP